MYKFFTLIILSFSWGYAYSTILEEDVPVVPRTALRKLAGNSKFDEIYLEKDESSLFYHATWTNGSAYEASVTEDGNLAIFIEEVQKDNMPVKVRKTIESLFSKATETTYQKETFLVYKIKATVDGKNFEALISPSGKMVGIKELAPNPTQHSSNITHP
jgi:hypothetical protein